MRKLSRGAVLNLLYYAGGTVLVLAAIACLVAGYDAASLLLSGVGFAWIAGAPALALLWAPALEAWLDDGL